MRVCLFDAGYLRKHLKMHTGEKSHKCNQCDYAASYASILRTDLKMHCGEKSNKCNQCDNASSLAGNLRKRLKTHSMHCSSPLSNIKLDPFVFIISYQPKAKSHLDIQIPPMVKFCKLKVWKIISSPRLIMMMMRDQTKYQHGDGDGDGDVKGSLAYRNGDIGY